MVVREIEVGLDLGLVVEDLSSPLNSGALSAEAAQALQEAIDNIIGNNGGQASNGAIDQWELENFNAALVKIREAIESLEDAETADDSLKLTGEKRVLALVGAAIAEQAVADAQEIASTPKDAQNIETAQALITNGRSLIYGEEFLGSIDLFQEALTYLKSPQKGKKSITVNALRLEIVSIANGDSHSDIRFKVSVPPGVRVGFEHSRDLIEWEPLQTIDIAPSGVSEVQIPREKDSGSRFYRLRQMNLDSK